MRLLLQFWDSTIGKKWVMAVTGIGLVLFAIAHMAGNLQVFLGADVFNDYAHKLQSLGPLLWIARAGLFTMAVLHIISAYQLTMRARQARPQGYAMQTPQVSTLASRTMRVGGVILALFLIYHILHFTTGQLHPAFSKGGAYGNVVLGFRVWWVGLFYIVAMSFFGLHLYHGVWAGFRTLGVAKPNPMPLERKLALGVAIVVWAGFIIVPIGVMLGIVN
ncbi:MAG: succinate dehydrogenase cytochrome b subunit [Gemmatimonadaceae bacterium]|nr:succinate dehydrogenase cytochrome b subunit [Gemmatimonadaceae bacterium]